MATENLTVKIGANIKEFEKKMSKMQGRMDKIGGKFQSIGSTFTKGSAAIVGGAAAAGAGLYGLTNKVTQNADAIAKGSERMGVSTKAYQEMDFWASQNGLSQENMEKVVGRLNQRLGLAVDGNEKYASALEKLGVDLNGVRDGTVSTEDAMAQSIQTLSTMENENEKAALASELFGTKMSRELLPALNDGSLSMEDAKKKAQELGLVMSDDQLKAAEAFQDAQDQIKRSLGAVGMQIGLDLMPHFQRMHEWILANLPQIRSTISGAFESVVDTVKSVIDWWQNLSDRMKTIIPVVAGLALAFGPIMLVVGKVITIVSGLIGIFAPLMASITKAGGLLKWMAPLFTKIGSVIAVLTGPIGLTVAAIAALGAGFVLAYNKSETFRNFIDGLKDRFVNAWESAMEFKDKVVDAFKGITAFFKGDTESGIDLLRSIGLSDETIETVYESVAKIRRTFTEMKTKVQLALSEVGDFFKGIFSDLQSWWDSDGALIISAIGTVFENTFEGIKRIAGVGLKFVQSLFETFAPIVSGIWNVLWPTVVTVAKNAWAMIQLVIGTAMDLVQGIISGVSALIEGDWSRFGEIMKETALSIKDRVVEFFGNMKDNALELINNLTGGGIDKFVELKDGAIEKVIEMKDSVVGWFTNLKDTVGFRINTMKLAVELYFREMVSNTVSKITEMYNSITGWFSDLGTSVKDTATNIKNNVTSRFTELKDNTINRVKNAYDNVTSKFSNMRTSVSDTAKNLRRNVTDRFTELKDNTIGRASDAYDGVTGWFGDMFTSVTDTATNIKDDTVGLFIDMKDGAVDGVQTLYDGATGIFSDLKDFAADTFTDMVDGAKELPGRIGDAIKNAASFAVDGVKSLGNSLSGKLGEVVDGVTGGLNGILGKIGIDDLIPDISIPTFSTGTSNGRLASDTLGIVNDKGPGNGRGGATQELIQRGSKILMPQGDNALVGLKKGDKIFNGAETQSIMSSGMLPRFSQGTGSEGGNTGGKKGLLGTIGDVMSNVWSYISDPGKAFNAVIDSVTPDFGGLNGFMGDVASGGFNLIKDKALDWLTGIFKDNEGALGSGQAGSFMGYRMTTPYSPNSPVPGYPRSFNGGKHYGIDYATPIGTPIEAPLGGQLSSMSNTGGGLIAKLVTGQLRQFFMHMSSVAPPGSVQAGDVIGKTGNSGQWTTGAHVHWQAQQGTDTLNRNTVDPLKVVGHANGGIFRNRHIAEINEEGPEAIIPLSAKRRGRANSLYDSVGRQIGRDDNGRDQARVIDLLEKQNALLKERMGQPVYLDGKKVNDELATMDAVDSALRFN